MGKIDLSDVTTGPFIGYVKEVDYTSIELRLPAKGPDGHDAYGPSVGEPLLILSHRILYFGHVTRVYAPESTNPNAEALSFASVNLLATITQPEGNVVIGIGNTPNMNDRAYVAPAALAKFIAEGADDKSVAIKVELGRFSYDLESKLSFSPEALFGRHMAILGATGGGKSWSVARIIEQVARFKSKLILFDATGEYRDLAKGTKHIYIGKNRRAQDYEKEVTVPYYHLTETDLFAIFEPRGESQAPKLRAAMKSLKLAQHSRTLAPDGTIFKAHKSRLAFEEEYQKYRRKIEKPLADFEIRNLPRQIEHECVDPQRSPTEPDVWGGINSRDLSHCTPLINRIEDMISLPSLSAIFKPKKLPSVFNELHDFLDDDSLQVLRISLETFSFAHNAREIVVNALGRHLLDLARVEAFRNAPLFVVLDEAHQFLNTRAAREDDDLPLDAFSLIAKEGRKYALNVLLATQRPRDIPEGVLSQMGTFLIHRLTNDSDRRIVERACGELNELALNKIPGLAPGEAVLLGIEFPVPLPIKVFEPNAKPTSSGPNYQKHWEEKSRIRVVEDQA